MLPVFVYFATISCFYASWFRHSDFTFAKFCLSSCKATALLLAHPYTLVKVHSQNREHHSTALKPCIFRAIFIFGCVHFFFPWHIYRSGSTFEHSFLSSCRHLALVYVWRLLLFIYCCMSGTSLLRIPIIMRNRSFFFIFRFSRSIFAFLPF